MSFLRPNRSVLNGCSCERRGPGARGALGATDPVVSGQTAAAIASAGLAKALAATATGREAVYRLRDQVKRFGGTTIGIGVTLDSGVLDVALAGAVIGLLQQRYLSALGMFPGETSDAIARLQQVTSAQAMVDPVGWILAGGAGGIDQVTDLIQRYGDSKGLPPASKVISIPGGPSTLIAVGVAGAAYLFFRGRRGRKGSR